MIGKREVLALAKQALRHFNAKCEVKFLSFSAFRKIALQSSLIRQALEEGWAFEELKIPALIYHQEKDHIYLNEKILNTILRKVDKAMQKEFVKSVIYHELFHILYEHQLRKNNFVECLKSEERACNAFKKKYPALYKIGYDAHSRATQL
ncbi:MAG TPA: hypothetical protein VJJ75_01610 [Candidatus Nanoarchaeia archaeon]|nr:hypothetical protein [Candidatus Nanoarchaeia archaeon]